MSSLVLSESSPPSLAPLSALCLSAPEAEGATALQGLDGAVMGNFVSTREPRGQVVYMVQMSLEKPWPILDLPLSQAGGTLMVCHDGWGGYIARYHPLVKRFVQGAL